MGKLYDRLQKQLKTEYKKDAEDCLIIYNKLKEMHNGSVWDSNWTPLVDTVFKGFPSDERRFKPTGIGKIFLNGLNNTK
jgi:hypothetical protein